VALLADITSCCQIIGNGTTGDRVREQGDEECFCELHCEGESFLWSKVGKLLLRILKTESA
jgi:hypothetical protein